EIAELDYPHELKREIEIAKMRYMTQNFYEQLMEGMEGKAPELTRRYAGFLERSGLEWADVLKEDKEINKMPKDKRNALYELKADIAMQIMTNLPNSLQRALIIPDRILHYRAINKGRKTAHNVIIKVKPKGMLHSIGKVDSGDEILNVEQKNESIIIRLKRLSPTYTVEGSLWYVSGEFEQEEVPIKISFDEGVAKLEKYHVISQPFPWYFWLLILLIVSLIVISIVQNQIAIYIGKRKSARENK
ncbi:unnamed protein product, partial [marine sediment metagenome]